MRAWRCPRLAISGKIHRVAGKPKLFLLPAAKKYFPKLLMQRFAHQKRKAEKLEAGALASGRTFLKSCVFDVSQVSGRYLGFRAPVP